MIFCVEDDANIRELEVYTLRNVGYEAMGVASGKELFEALAEFQPHLIILDVMLPDEDGISILKNLRSKKEYRNIPIIMATAKGSEFDKVRGLDEGADDYIVKPFGMMEMVSRVKALLRRSNKDDVKPLKQEVGILAIDTEKYKVWVNKEEVVLTFKEFEVLKKLMDNKGKVYSREELLDDIWGYDFSGETRTVDVHIRTLRQKLGDAGDFIETVRGVGYRFKDHF